MQLPNVCNLIFHQFRILLHVLISQHIFSQQKKSEVELHLTSLDMEMYCIHWINIEFAMEWEHRNIFFSHRFLSFIEWRRVEKYFRSKRSIITSFRCICLNSYICYPNNANFPRDLFELLNFLNKFRVFPHF